MSIVQAISNSSYGLVIDLSKDPKTGRITVNQDANYIDFEKILLNKLDASISIPRDMKVQRSEEKQLQYEKDERKRIFEEKKKKNYFYALRKRVTDHESMVVKFFPKGSLYLQ